LIILNDVNGNNFIYHLISYSKPEIIENTFEILKENLSIDQYQEVLRSKGIRENNLLLKAATCNKNLETHKVLWKIIINSCNSEFSIILENKDIRENNIVHLAISNSNCKIFNFMVEEIEKNVSRDEVKNILNDLNFYKENLLQSAALRSNSVKNHENLWKIIEKYFNATEIAEMINNFNTDEENVFHLLVNYNTKDVLELTWEKIKKYIPNGDDQISYLNNTEESFCKLSQNNNYDCQVRDWIKKLLN